MQRPNEEKRRLICRTAAKLFASRPFHEVRLEDVAAEADVGKGTVYVYFKSKEDLHASIIAEGLDVLMSRLNDELRDAAQPAGVALRAAVRQFVRFAVNNPHYFELIRTAEATVLNSPQCQERRKALAELLESVLRRGVRRGELADPHPELTALFIPGMIRSAMLFGPKGLDERTLTQQILRLLEHGLVRPSQTKHERGTKRVMKCA